MTIDVKEFTTCKVSDDGTTVVLDLVDRAGTPISLSFEIGELGNLVMTLPSLIELALRRKYRDASFRYTYPIGSWAIEAASDPASLIVTLRTTDGFGVSFAMERGNAHELGLSMSSSAVRSKTATAH